MLNLNTLTHPLDEIKSTKGVLKLTKLIDDLFDKLTQDIICEVRLSYLEDSKPFLVVADASEFWIGAWIGQGHTSCNTRYIYFASRSISKPERNYTPTKRELLALVYALRKFLPYLLGRKVKALMDHRALTYLNNMLQRWFETIISYDMEIVNLAGSQNIMADALSQK